MIKKQNILIFPLIIMGVFLVFSSSCKKDDNNNPTNGQTTAVFNLSATYGTMTDQDGNVYKTITIGFQTWMAENLRTTMYNDSTDIPKVTDIGEWGISSTDAYCNYNNTTNIDTVATYGRLYNWYAVNTGKLAPRGWHVPTYAEWKELLDFLGGSYVAGGKLKETGTTHWYSPNIGATNESGFTALPGGAGFNGGFAKIDEMGEWWGANEYSASSAWHWDMGHGYSGVGISHDSKELGFSVRCVRD